MESPSDAGFAGGRMFPSILILLANIGGWLHLLPVPVQLIINSCACVYLGTIMSSKIFKGKNGQIEISAKDKDAEHIGKK